MGPAGAGATISAASARSAGRRNHRTRPLVAVVAALVAVVVVSAACEYMPANLPPGPLSECRGEAATIGIGYSDGSTSIPADPPGGATYTGTAARDVVVIANGPVTFEGLGGDDLICVVDRFENGAGTITVRGGPGNDEIHSTNPLPHLLDGGDGDDTIVAGPGDDTLLGGDDDDVLVGGDGDDDCYADSVAAGATVCDGANIVVLLLDDLDETTTPYWDAMTQTKALLADSGLTFDEAFATNAVCCPARATMLTGRLPHNTGVVDGTPPDGAWPAFFNAGGENDTIATRLDAAGYQTGYFGKYMNWYFDASHIPKGWDRWFAFNGLFEHYNGYDYTVSDDGVRVAYGSTPADYQTDVLASEATAFVNSTEAADDDPFLLFLSPTAPHKPLPPAPRHNAPNPFGSDPLPTLPNFNETDVSDKPTWLRDGVAPLDSTEIQALTQDHRDRMGSLLAVDEMVAGLIATLSANDELDETVFVFTSDNGYNLGAHRMPLKQLPYDESARVPFVIAGVDVGTGTVSDLVTHADVAPTIADLAGLDGTDMDGRSLVPLIDGSAAGWRSDFLIQFRGTYSPYANDYDTLADVQAGILAGDRIWAPSHRAVRTDRWLYIEWYEDPAHEYELYDVVADPHQLDNLLVTEPGVHTATAAGLQARLDTLATCSGATCQ